MGIQVTTVMGPVAGVRELSVARSLLACRDSSRTSSAVSLLMSCSVLMKRKRCSWNKHAIYGIIEGAWLTEGRWWDYAVLLVCAYKVRVSPRLGLFSGVALWVHQISRLLNYLAGYIVHYVMDSLARSSKTAFARRQRQRAVLA